MRKLKLNNQIYELEAIKAAIQAYHQFCRVDLTLSSEYYILTLDGCMYDEDLTAGEFCNAVLVETIRRKGSLYD